MRHHQPNPSTSRHAFTLIELLVGVVIITILMGLAFGAYSMALSGAKRTTEINAAKQLMAAYHAYSADHSGRLMPGLSESKVKQSDGSYVSAYLAKRWPYRLEAYLNGNFEDTVVVNEALDNYHNAGKMSTYTASVFPTFGLNTTFVGGNYDNHLFEPVVGRDEKTFGKFAVTRQAQAFAPNKLIVFISATQDGSGGEKTYGNYYALAPNSRSQKWADSYDESKPANNYGYVHCRYDGKAVAAHLDGSVEALDFEELKDMTRWSNQAAQDGDPDWQLTAK